MPKEDTDQETLIDDGSAEDTHIEEAPEVGVESEPEVEAQQDGTPDNEGDEADQSQPLTSESEDGNKSQAQVDYEKRFKGAQRSWQQEVALRKELEQKLAEQQSRLQELQQASERQGLPVYNPQSPKFGEYQQKRPLVEQYLRQVQANRDDPDTLNMIAKTWEGIITAQDVEMYQQEAREHAEFQRRMAQDPRAALGELVRQEAEQIIQKQTQQQQLYSHYQQLYARPENAELLKDQSALELFVTMVDKHNWDPETALEHIRIKRENDRLRSLATKGEQTAASAKAQKQIAKGRAKVDADIPAATKPRDIFQEARSWAKKNGYELQSGAHLRYLRKLEQETAS